MRILRLSDELVLQEWSCVPGSDGQLGRISWLSRTDTLDVCCPGCRGGLASESVVFGDHAPTPELVALRRVDRIELECGGDGSLVPQRADNTGWLMAGRGGGTLGVQSDYLIAHESEAETIYNTLCPLTDGRWKGIDAKRFDMVVMSELMAVLDVVDEWVTLAGGTEEDETWIYKVPDRLTDALAAVDDASLEQVARDWVAQETYPGRWHLQMQHKQRSQGLLTKLFGRGRGTAVEERPLDFSSLLPGAKDMLVEFRSLAKEAKEQDKHLLLWGST